MPEIGSDPRRFLPLSPADLQLLLVLMDGERHAYGISKAAEGQSVPLEIGSLYRMLARLEEWGLIDGQPGTQPSPDGPRRKVYRITALGRAVVRAEAQRMREMVRIADARLRAVEGSS